VPGQGAIRESSDIGLVDDVHHAARCFQETDTDQHHGADRGHLAAGPDAQSGSALHAPVHDCVDCLLETFWTRANPGDKAQVVVSPGWRAGGRTNFGIGQRHVTERVHVHAFSLPWAAAGMSLRRTVNAWLTHDKRMVTNYGLAMTASTARGLARASGTVTLGGELTVNRLGFGARRLTGNGAWGPPADHGAAVQVLRRTVELGVNFIDTADAYGPYISEEMIREALHPYTGLVIATKAGLLLTGPSEWTPLGNPTYLRQECEMSLRRLGVDTIDLFQLHRVDPNIPLADQVGALAALKKEGKIRHIGLCEIDVDQLAVAQQITPIVSVQNKYNLTKRTAEPLLDTATSQGIGFIPFFPLAAGPLAAPDGPLQEIAASHHATPAQLALAWLLKRSPMMLPIPGTSSAAHLEENVAAAEITLTDDEFESLAAVGSQHAI
jgi:pyridoxine 4-dehydrogenase